VSKKLNLKSKSELQIARIIEKLKIRISQFVKINSKLSIRITNSENKNNKIRILQIRIKSRKLKSELKFEE